MSVVNMKINGLEKPIGYNYETLLLSWQVESGAVRQVEAAVSVFCEGSLIWECREDVALYTVLKECTPNPMVPTKPEALPLKSALFYVRMVLTKVRNLYAQDTVRLPWQYMQKSHGGVYNEGPGEKGGDSP